MFIGCFYRWLICLHGFSCLICWLFWRFGWKFARCRQGCAVGCLNIASLSGGVSVLIQLELLEWHLALIRVGLSFLTGRDDLWLVLSDWGFLRATRRLRLLRSLFITDFEELLGFVLFQIGVVKGETRWEVCYTGLQWTRLCMILVWLSIHTLSVNHNRVLLRFLRRSGMESLLTCELMLLVST